MVTNTGRFQLNGRTAAQWTAANTVLLSRELGVESDTLKVKVGDGSTAWTALPYLGATVTAGVSSWAGRTGAVTPTKTDVGLGSVDNTADTAKPVSTAQATALAGKVTYPAGGVDGQALVKSGTAAAWATISGGGGTAASYTVFNVKTYGAKGDGSTDDTAAINAAKTAAEAAATSAVFAVAANAVYFPPGRYIYNGNLTVATARMVLLGDGPTTSIIYRGSSGTGDIVTLDATHSGIRSLGINGGNVSGSGDLLVMSAAYVFASDFRLENGAANALTIGKGSSAIEARLNMGFIRYPKGYGIQVITGSGSTDGLWSDLDIGNTGLSAVRIDNGSQNLENIHVWGAGLLSTTDMHGFWLNSDRNALSNCQAETCRGDGFHLTGKGNGVTGGSSWGNRQAGVYLFAATNSRVTGVGIYRNGVANTAGTTSNAYAGIFNDGANSVTITGCNVYDDGASVPDGTYSGSWTPTSPFLGRTAQTTQSYAYAEGPGTDYTTVTGNTFRKEQTRSGTAIVTVANDAVWAGNQLGAQTAAATTAAATIFPKPYSDLVKITGTATVTTIWTTKAGRRLTLLFPDAAPGAVASNPTGGTGNIYLAGGTTWTPTTNDTITLVSDGTSWFETSRSAN